MLDVVQWAETRVKHAQETDYSEVISSSKRPIDTLSKNIVIGFAQQKLRVDIEKKWTSNVFKALGITVTVLKTLIHRTECLQCYRSNRIATEVDNGNAGRGATIQHIRIYICKTSY